MQTRLNVGVDVAKDAVVVACAERSFPVQSVPNQRASLRAWLKSLPAGGRTAWNPPAPITNYWRIWRKPKAIPSSSSTPRNRHYARPGESGQNQPGRCGIDRPTHRTRASALAALHASDRHSTPAGSADSTTRHDRPPQRHAQADHAPSGRLCRRTQDRDRQGGCLDCQD